MQIIRWFIALFLLSVISCRNDDGTIKRSEIIPEKTLVPLLVEIHLSDGLLQMSPIRQMYPGRDSISNYEDILRKYGYGKEDFDKTIRYYGNEPDELDELYDQVIGELTKIQSEIQNLERQMEPEEQASSLWNSREIWHLPVDGKTESIDFSIPVTGHGKYIITATICMYADDGSLNPAISAFFWFDNGTKEGFRSGMQTLPVRKDGIEAEYVITAELTDSRVTHLRGKILDHMPQQGEWQKHVDVTGIKVHFIPISRIKQQTPAIVQ